MKPVVILDPHWRRMDELFTAIDLARLADRFRIVWGRDGAIPQAVFAEALPQAFAIVAAAPRIDAGLLQKAPHLKAVAEVSGAFPDSIDYPACAARGVEVLSCAPGFHRSVAEMCLAMILSGARGLVQEHELFRVGGEHWLDDNPATDFSLYGADVGFVGYGAIARETHRLLAPFGPAVRVFDPWLAPEAARAAGVRTGDLDWVLRNSRCVVVAAAPTRENRHLIDRAALAQLRKGALLVLISRAHLVDFDAVTEAAQTGAIRAAIDVFPTEPVAVDDPVRKVENVLLSPHRAAAVPGGRQLIGAMLTDDLIALADGGAPTRLQRAGAMPVERLAGVGRADEVADMAAGRS